MFVNKKDLLEKIKKQNEDMNDAIKKRNEDIQKIISYKKMYIPFNLKDAYNSVIPLHLYTCWHTSDLPPLMKENYDYLVQSNPKIQFHLYNEDSCREFIKNNFKIAVVDAYDSLIPCSYKSDLWRFCVLYINGGIYMDIKYRCVNNFKFITLTEKEHFVRDRPNNCVYTALIVAKPNNKIMLKCINQIVKNVGNKYYGTNALDPTGPGLLGSFFNTNEINNLKLYFTDINVKNVISKDYIVYDNNIILEYYPNYREEQKINQKNEYYSILWNKRKIYK